LLEQWARTVARSFGPSVYLVGSVARAEPYRDVDVRLMLPRLDYINLAGTHFERIQLFNVALSLYGQRMTGLPIDFQFQEVDEANEEHGGRRIPIGMEVE
jgi:hypothetical protein